MICTDYELGINAYKAGDFPASAEYFIKVVEADPHNWKARHFLASCYQKMGFRLKAHRAFRYIFERCPDADLRVHACEQL